MYNERSKVVSYFRKNPHGPHGDVRINSYYTTGTVGTALYHPVQGRTQLFRKKVQTQEQLSAIFANPRIHTGKGYYIRQDMEIDFNVTSASEYELLVRLQDVQIAASRTAEQFQDFLCQLEDIKDEMADRQAAKAHARARETRKQSERQLF
jgi:hypothetical protein